MNEYFWMFLYKYIFYICFKKGDFIVSFYEFIFFIWFFLGVWVIGWGWEIYYWRCGFVDKGGILERGSEY